MTDTTMAARQFRLGTLFRRANSSNLTTRASAVAQIKRQMMTGSGVFDRRFREAAGVRAGRTSNILYSRAVARNTLRNLVAGGRMGVDAARYVSRGLSLGYSPPQG